MIVGEIITRLGFKTDTSPQQKFVKANKEAEKSSKGASTAATAMGTAIGSAATQIASKIANLAAQAPAQLFELARSFSVTGDEIAKTSRQIGISTQDLQRLRFAAARSGVSNQALEASFKKLAIGIDQGLVKGKGPAVDALKRIGLQAQDLAGVGAEEQLAMIADGLKSIEDPSESAAVRLALLGRAGLEMGTLFEAGGDEIRKLGDRAQQLGGVMGDDALKGAEALNDGLYDVTYTMDALKNRVAAAAAPALAQLSDKFATAISENDQFIEQDLPNAIVAIADALVTLIPIMVDAIQGIAGMVKEIKDAASWFANEFPQATAIMGQAVEALADPWGSLANAVDWVITKVDELLGRTQAIRGFIDQVGVAAGIIDPSQESAVSRARQTMAQDVLGVQAPGAEARLASINENRSSKDLRAIAKDEKRSASERQKAESLLPAVESRENNAAANKEAAEADIKAAQAESKARLQRARGKAAKKSRQFRIDPETGEPMSVAGGGGGGGGKRKKGEKTEITREEIAQWDRELDAWAMANNVSADRVAKMRRDQAKELEDFKIIDSIGDLINGAGESKSIKGDAAREPLSGAQVVRIDATFSAPTTIDVKVDGAKLGGDPASVGTSIADAISSRLDVLHRQAFDHYRQAVRP